MTEPRRSGWLEWLADSVSGVFDVETRPIQAGELVRLATDGRCAFCARRVPCWGTATPAGPT